MGVNTNIYVKQEDLVRMMEEDPVLFCRLVEWCHMRWYRFKDEVVPNIEEYIYHEIITTEDIKQYLMRHTARIRYRDDLVDTVKYDIKYAPDTTEDEDIGEGYVMVYSLFSILTNFVKRYSKEVLLSELKKLAGTEEDDGI
jgi:hypothetical protein